MNKYKSATIRVGNHRTSVAIRSNFVIERCPGRLRSILIGDELHRIHAPDLVFVTNYSEGSASLSYSFYVFAEVEGKWFAVDIPHVDEISCHVCLGSAKPALVKRLKNKEPPRLAETFWLSGFGHDLVIDDVNWWSWRAVLNSDISEFQNYAMKNE